MKWEIEHWKEYIPSEELPPVNCNTSFFEDLPLTSPYIDVITKALSKLKNHKSPGFDGISNEKCGLSRMIDRNELFH